MVHNPVMFVVEVGSVLTTGLWIHFLSAGNSGEAWFDGIVCVWLWFTVLFANFSEALAEGRGKAQAESLDALARIRSRKRYRRPACGRGEQPKGFTMIPSADLRQGDLYMVEAGDILPADGEVVLGSPRWTNWQLPAESAPVIRETGGDRSAVTGGTRLFQISWL